MEWGVAPNPTAGAECPAPSGLPVQQGETPCSPHGHILHNARESTADCASDNGDLIWSIKRLDRSNAGVRERLRIAPPSARSLLSSVLNESNRGLCGVLRPQRKGPTGGWVVPTPKSRLFGDPGPECSSPLQIKNVPPTKSGRSVFEGRSAPLLRRRAEFDRRGVRGHPPVSLRNRKGVGQASPVVGFGATPHSNALTPASPA